MGAEYPVVASNRTSWEARSATLLAGPNAQLPTLESDVIVLDTTANGLPVAGVLTRGSQCGQGRYCASGESNTGRFLGAQAAN